MTTRWAGSDGFARVSSSITGQNFSLWHVITAWTNMSGPKFPRQKRPEFWPTPLLAQFGLHDCYRICFANGRLKLQAPTYYIHHWVASPEWKSIDCVNIQDCEDMPLCLSRYSIRCGVGNMIMKRKTIAHPTVIVIVTSEDILLYIIIVYCCTHIRDVFPPFGMSLL